MIRASIKSGYTLVELLTVMAIVVIVVSVGSTLYGPVLRRSDMQNQLKYMRAAFYRAKADAIENTCTVLFTYDVANNSVLAVRDHDRDGDFTDTPELVIASSSGVGAPSPYLHIKGDASKADNTPLPHWILSGDFNGQIMDTFTSNQFVIMPNGRVLSADTLDPTSGTFFFASDDDLYFGAVHITAVGEVKLAFLRSDEKGVGDFNGWKWL
jgi:prepilin-type N-terminal cleavage/methylation domain-containing protein